MRKKVLMIAYTDYSWDARVKREAGTLTSDFDVTILCLKENEGKRSYVSDGVQVEELDIEKYSGNNPLRYLLSYLHFSILCFLLCTKFLFQKKIDVLHVHNMPNSLVFSGLIPWVFGKKIVLDVHDCMPEVYSTKFGKWNRLLYRLLCWEEAISCAFARKIICVNHVQRDVLIRRGIHPGKLFVSMNVPDHRKFKRMPPAARVRPFLDSFRMAYHGTIARRLGVDLAIRAVAELKERAPEIEFHFWGGGESLEECNGLSKNLGIEDRVRFNGLVKVEELSEALTRVDVGIVPNRRNSATEVMLPVKMLEYITMGIPVLVPKLRAIQFYFSEEMVGYFEPDDLESLKQAILKLYQDRPGGRVMAENAQRFLDRYGWEIQSTDFINFYLSI